MKVKSFCRAEEIIKKMTRQPTDQEEKYANDETDKGLVSKTDKELKRLNIKKQTPSPPQKNNQKMDECYIEVFPKQTHRWQQALENMLNIFNC